MSEAPNHEPTARIQSRISARVQEMRSAIADEATSAEAASEASTPSPTADASGAASAPEAVEASAPDAAPGPAVTPSGATIDHDALEDKLKAARNKRAAQKARKEAEAALASTKAEQEKWDRIGKTGTYKDALKELGRDPRAEWEAMNREAIEAGTPEAQIRVMRAEHERKVAELNAKIEAAQKQNDERERAREEREKQFAAQQARHAFQADFYKTVQGQAYTNLRVEYDDADLLHFAEGFRQNPRSLFDTAKKYSVQLTNPGKSFTMPDVLNVLQAVQDAHEAKREARRAKLQAPASPGKPGTKVPTVNGTSAAKAGTTVGNDLASTRATDGSRRLSRKERIAQEIDRYEGRR